MHVDDDAQPLYVKLSVKKPAMVYIITPLSRTGHVQAVSGLFVPTAALLAGLDLGLPKTLNLNPKP